MIDPMTRPVLACDIFSNVFTCRLQYIYGCDKEWDENVMWKIAWNILLTDAYIQGVHYRRLHKNGSSLGWLARNIIIRSVTILNPGSFIHISSDGETILFLLRIFMWCFDVTLSLVPSFVLQSVKGLKLKCGVIRNDCRSFNNFSVWNELDYGAESFLRS